MHDLPASITTHIAAFNESLPAIEKHRQLSVDKLCSRPTCGKDIEWQNSSACSLAMF